VLVKIAGEGGEIQAAELDEKDEKRLTRLQQKAKSKVKRSAIPII